MLRRCRKDWLLFVNGFKKVKCFGAGPPSDRNACVEERKERKSMLDPRGLSGGMSSAEVALLGLCGYRPLPKSRFCFGS